MSLGPWTNSGPLSRAYRPGVGNLFCTADRFSLELILQTGLQ